MKEFQMLVEGKECETMGMEINDNGSSLHVVLPRGMLECDHAYRDLIKFMFDRGIKFQDVTENPEPDWYAQVCRTHESRLSGEDGKEKRLCTVAHVRLSEAKGFIRSGRTQGVMYGTHLLDQAALSEIKTPEFDLFIRSDGSCECIIKVRPMFDQIDEVMEQIGYISTNQFLNIRYIGKIMDEYDGKSEKSILSDARVVVHRNSRRFLKIFNLPAVMDLHELDRRAVAAIHSIRSIVDSCSRAHALKRA